MAENSVEKSDPLSKIPSPPAVYQEFRLVRNITIHPLDVRDEADFPVSARCVLIFGHTSCFDDESLSISRSHAMRYQQDSPGRPDTRRRRCQSSPTCVTAAPACCARLLSAWGFLPNPSRWCAGVVIKISQDISTPAPFCPPS